MTPTRRNLSQVNLYSDSSKDPTSRNTISSSGCASWGCSYTAQSSSGDTYYRISFTSSAIAWAGPCLSGTCTVCTEGSRRCTNQGRPRICIGGQVAPFRWIQKGNCCGASPSPSLRIVRQDYHSTVTENGKVTGYVPLFRVCSEQNFMISV